MEVQQGVRSDDADMVLGLQVPTAPILIVDDDLNIRESIRDFLQDEGFAVQMASQGREAIALIETGLIPSLVILDLSMPVMNGHQFLEWWMKDARVKERPVLVVSATPFGATLPPGVRMLRKPTENAEFLVGVHAALTQP